MKTQNKTFENMGHLIKEIIRIQMFIIHCLKINLLIYRQNKNILIS